MNSHERRITFDDGASTVVENWGSAGPNVLCLHGITGSRKSWMRTAGAMELAYAAHAYDQRGHGDSNVDGPMTFERIVRDCAEVADTIPGGIDTLIGHSWGGLTAILAGLQLPVSRVVAIDPLIRSRRKSWEAYWREEFGALFALQGAARERAIIEENRELHELDLAARIHGLQAISLLPILRIGSDNRADDGKLDIRESLVNYPKPLLIMLAEPAESAIAPADVEFVREHGGRNVTLRLFEGEGHSLHRTAFDEYMRVLNAFVGVPA